MANIRLVVQPRSTDPLPGRQDAWVFVSEPSINGYEWPAFKISRGGAFNAEPVIQPQCRNMPVECAKVIPEALRVALDWAAGEATERRAA